MFFALFLRIIKLILTKRGKRQNQRKKKGNKTKARREEIKKTGKKIFFLPFSFFLFLLFF